MTELVKAGTAERPAWVRDGTARVSIAVHDEDYRRTKASFKQQLFDTHPDHFKQFGGAAKFRAVSAKYHTWKAREVAWYAQFGLDVPGTRTTGPYVPPVVAPPPVKALVPRLPRHPGGTRLTDAQAARIRSIASTLPSAMSAYKKALLIEATAQFPVGRGAIRDVIKGTSHPLVPKVDPETRRAQRLKAIRLATASGNGHRFPKGEAQRVNARAGGRARWQKYWAEKVAALATAGLMLLVSAPAAAEDNPLKWDSHRPIADWVSTALVGVNVTAEAIQAFRSEDRAHALGCLALRNGLAIGASELAKLIFHRTRPDGSDRKSTWSEHAALASVNSGWSVNVSLPIAGSAGYLRMAADKHFLSDVTVGFGVGLLSREVCR